MRDSRSASGDPAADGVLYEPETMQPIAGLARAPSPLPALPADVEGVAKRLDELATKRAEADRVFTDMRFGKTYESTPAYKTLEAEAARMIRTLAARVSTLEEENKRLRTGLAFIEAWDLPNVETPDGFISYSTAYGSNGVRDFMRDVARRTLAARAQREGER